MIERAALMCHAPIVIPQIAGPRGQLCTATTNAMRKAAAFLKAAQADVTVVVSPHGERDDTWSLNRARRLTGSFAAFGHTDLHYEFKGAPSAAEDLAAYLEAKGLSTSFKNFPLDHGALVPLHFLSELNFRGPILLVTLPLPDDGNAEVFGYCLRQLAKARKERWVILASGDMSHRLLPGAPAGYHPAAQDFDAHIVKELAQGDLGGALAVPYELRNLAAEDVVQSLAVVWGAVDGSPNGLELLNYEGPFGVGYAEALLHQAVAGRSYRKLETPPSELNTIAREAIFAQASGKDYSPPQLGRPWDKAKPVFVTLREPDGELRGCIGSLRATRKSLSQEVAETAASAASSDPRFPPVTPSEVADLKIEVSVLEDPVPIDSAAELDPERYGVVVSRGWRRGVLLPNVQGVDSAEQQIAIAKKKAGIPDWEPVHLERFLVRKARTNPSH